MRTLAWIFMLIVQVPVLITVIYLYYRILRKK